MSRLALSSPEQVHVVDAHQTTTVDTLIWPLALSMHANHRNY